MLDINPTISIISLNVNGLNTPVKSLRLSEWIGIRHNYMLSTEAYFILFFKILFYLFIYLFYWLCWVFVAARRLSLVEASRGYSLLWCMGFSLWWLLFVAEHGL